MLLQWCKCLAAQNLAANLQTAGRLIAETSPKYRRSIAEVSQQGAKLVLLPEVFAVLEGGPTRQYGEVEGAGPIQSFLADQARLECLL
jgi:predicted amidohydrolase